MIHRTAHILYSYLHRDTTVAVKEVQDPSQNDHTYLLSLVGLSGCGRAPTACHPSIPVRRRSVCSVIPGQKRFGLMRTSPCNDGVSESGDRWFRRATPALLTGIPPSEYDCLASSKAMSMPLESSILIYDDAGAIQFQ